MSIEGVTNQDVPIQQTGSSAGVAAFMAKIESGVGIEALILQDTHAQRRAGQLLRTALREQRRQLIKEAVKKMKEAADKRLTSAICGALVQTGTTLAGSFLEAPLGDWLNSDSWAKCITKGAEAVAFGFAEFNWMDVEAVEMDGEAKLLEEYADAAGENASDTSSWLDSARELEQRMIDHLSATTDGEHQTRQQAIGSS